ncbi:hypothetical protein C0Q70_04749 [Pomacea canaliculata]|uniref:Uncharacterized protein n=1 Tax=Pomacea canaliculata TaxID=400727 RepID=A0A2T7PJ85_POMCA|nr:hypothetical protein C0Q70_04749 [Pomacea canaliculata]
MESGPQTQESSVVATSQDMSHTNKTLPHIKTATELNTAAESSNWTLVNDLLSADGVCRCDVEQCCLLHKLAAAPEVSLSLARDILTKILKHKVDINMLDTNGDTAVVVAARCDNTKMVMELLSRQAALPPDVTHVCSFLQTLTNNWKPQETPYMHALVVKLLWDRLQDTALHSCHKQLHHTLVRLAVTFHTSLVREMFVAEQQVNSVDSEGMAVLHRVAMFDSEDHVRVVLFLIIKGANLNLQNTTGDTPLHVAVKHKNWNMMEVLLHRRGKSDVMDCEQRSVLHIAASFSDPVQFPNIDKILPLLIRNNNDINKEDGEGNTPLHLAALAGNIRFMKTLLDHGARADGVNKEQKTVLHMMATAKNNTSSNVDSLRKVLSLIVKRGAPYQKTDCAGHSALHLGAKNGNWTLVEFLLQLTHKVGDLNSKCHLGDSAIHLAAKCQNWDIVKLLVEEGALIDELDNEGFHVLHKMAMGESVDKDLLSLFVTNSFNFNIPCLAGDTVVHMASRHNNWSMVECLIEHVGNIDEVDSDGLAVIQRLVLSTKGKLPSHFSLFSRLIELGADCTCRDLNGDTVLHLAARNDHWDIVQYLVDLGEGTPAPDSEGFVILHRASVRGIPDSSARELFLSLLKCKPDLDKRTKQGDTAIHLAAKHDQWEVVMILIEHSANIFDCDSEDTSVLQRILRNLCSLQSVVIVQLQVKETAIEQDTNFHKELAFEAARCGNWDVVKFLVDQRVNTHHVDPEGL